MILFKCNILLRIFYERRFNMATVYCYLCIYCYKKGGVDYCGNNCSPYAGGSVSVNSPKCCDYFKSINP